MKSRRLPNGLKYEIDRVNPGVIVPGTDREPAVTITVREGTIQYRLISYIMSNANALTCEGDIPQPILDYVESWVSSHLPMLFAEANLHHIVRFDKKSMCYYDFLSETLYYANGYYEKKGSTAGGLKNVAEINGKPISLPDSAIPFIEILTKRPTIGFSTEIFIDGDIEDEDELKRAKNNISQAFYKFLRYDSSIKHTFKKEKTGSKQFKYDGEPQEWYVGDNVQNGILTVKKIYDAVVQLEILTICDPLKDIPVNSILAENITSEEAVAFIGLDPGLFDTSLIDIKQFFETNRFESTAVLKAMLSTYCTMLDAIWARMAKNIKNNFLHSLSASTYFKDTKSIPHHQSDYLRVYPLNEERLRIILNGTYPVIAKFIKDFGFEKEFFKDRDFDITQKKEIISVENAINGIVSLILLCFYCCFTSLVDEELDRLKKLYQEKLIELIQKKFDSVPPSDSGNIMFDPETFQMQLQRLLAISDKLSREGKYEYASEIDKIVDEIKKLGYNDENSLLPPSRGREL